MIHQRETGESGLGGGERDGPEPARRIVRPAEARDLQHEVKLGGLAMLQCRPPAGCLASAGVHDVQRLSDVQAGRVTCGPQYQVPVLGL